MYTPSPVPQLPPELWEQVIDHLWNDTPTLRECSLTCRVFFTSSRYHLFYRIELCSQLACLCFRDALDSSSAAGTDIALYVKIINIVGLPLCRLGDQYDSGNALLLHDIITRLPNVSELQLDNVDLDVHLPMDYLETGEELQSFSHLFPLPDLKSLRLSSVMVHSIHDITRLIAAFPRLSTLNIERALWWQDNSDSPLAPTELEDARGTLQHLGHLSLFTVPSPIDLLRRIQRFPSLQATRQFGWTTYVADEKRILLGLLRDSASSIRVLDLVTRYDCNIFADLDASEYANVQSLDLNLAASSHDLDAFCPSLPPFLTQFDATNLRELTLGFSLFRPTNMYWTFVDWAAMDAALVQLHARKPSLTVLIRIAFVPAAGLSDNVTADIAAPLVEYLPHTLRAQTRVGVRCDLCDSMTGAVLRQGSVRWLLSDGE
ncbi:uncharacterized protein C8Q71DRAFT_113496 [Rhodofomes roseus]|uniref:F-box domain-containing protein n=1 Tax=Rhodofomes roseus TaxID=34475 RepID=A0ABQ8KCQ7_9APHY|nr:uncharacterized protein C8Q71DRAFT_113496 [Rhodofomes roseus]KAH9835317.1 hypothetical protein C8Q71DRAFT_113496 [Rhodofomes roseus]